MENNNLTPIKRFWLLLRPDRFEIRNVYIYSIFIGIVNLTLPIGIQAIVNLIQGGTVSTSWIILVVFVTAGIAFAGIMQINQLRITENLQQKIFTRAAFEFTYRIPRIRLENLFKHYAPELMNRFFDVVSVQKGLSKILIDFSTAGIQVLFGLILLSFYHPFFIIFSFLLVALVIFILRFTVNKGIETSLVESKHKYKIAHWLEELARANTTFKMAGETKLPMNRVNDSTHQYIDAREEHFSVLVRQYSLLVLFKVLVALGLLLIGGLLVIEQKMNIGQFVAAEIVILLIINSVEKLILSFETIYDVLTSLEKIGQVTDLPLESSEGISMNTGSTGMVVECKELNYAYPGESTLVIDHVSLKIQPGERVLVTGPNDSGKSTLLHLMAGLLQPVSGFVALDDIPVGNYRYSSLHDQIGSQLREETLFEGTLLENISLGREKATFEHIKETVEMLGLTDLIKHLPQGYDTKILPHGKQFSKSTTVKILLARALAVKPRLLILENSFASFAEDEATNLLSHILDKKHPWTVVISSTHPSKLFSRIDREITLENGKLIKS